MVEKNIIISNNEKIIINALDIYQLQIIDSYNKALNIKNIRTLLHFICRSRGYSPYLSKTDDVFHVSLNKYDKYLAENIQENSQEKYNSAVISMVKRMLTTYHKKKPININHKWWETPVEFDPSILTKKELGILTRILKKENKRLELLGIVGRRKKKAYYRKIFFASYS